MGDTGPAGAYSTEEIHRLLQQIRAEQAPAKSKTGSPPTPPGSSTTPDPASTAKASSSGQFKSNPDLGVTQELSLEEILSKIRREIGEEKAGSRTSEEAS